jgi:nitroimidazol reductase NimA-like FMN-containing flavoprotein (pyridoxamine 5'-phosphate oxidase superfamily)
MSEFTPTTRTQVHRLPDRGHYDSETVHRILDEGFLCHVGFVVDGQPFVIPTGYARVSDAVYLHGSAASRMLRTLAGGVQVCVTVTLVDGLVVARSAFHHSMNYRSVVILGQAHTVEDRDEKLRALEAFTNHIVPGRWNAVRPVRDSEVKATSVLKLSLQEVSAKIRTGPPKDEPEDYELPIWAGVLPLKLTAGEPVADSKLPDGAVLPEILKYYSRAAVAKGERL